MTTANHVSEKKFFLNKRFYLHVKSKNTDKATKLIKVFGGQIDQFLEETVTYVLTDVPRNDWPPHGRWAVEQTCNIEKGTHDKDLVRAASLGVKFMSFEELINWCSKYVSSQSSSDEDDESTNITHLKEPFIKFEDALGQYAPTVKELTCWPEIHIPLKFQVGKPIFYEDPSDANPNQSASIAAQLTQQAISARTTTAPNVNITGSSHHPRIAPVATNQNIINGNHLVPQSPQISRVASKSPSLQNVHTNNNATPNQQAAKRKHCIYCEICNLKIPDKLQEHIQSQLHKSNIDKMNWSEVTGVIESLPNLSVLNTRRFTSLPPRNSENQEFLCLHKVESVSQIFFSNKDFQSLSPMTDRKLVQIQ